MNKKLILTTANIFLANCGNQYVDPFQSQKGVTTNADKSLFCSEVFSISANLHLKLSSSSEDNIADLAKDHQQISAEFYTLFTDSPKQDRDNAKTISMKNNLASHKHSLEEISKLTSDCMSYAFSLGYAPWG